MENLTPKQAVFVREYLIDLNGTQAAIRAGYTPKSADVQAAQLLGNPRIKKEVEKALEKRAAKVEITAEMVLEGLLREATREGDGTSQGAKVRAWELLGKHLGILQDKQRLEIGGDVSMFLAASLERYERLSGDTRFTQIQQAVDDEA